MPDFGIGEMIALASSLAGPVMKMIGGGGQSGGGGKQKSAAAAPAAAAPAVKNLFSSPQQIQTATDRYKDQGTAKWNQIMAGMGAGGGTGGPDVATQIGSQASQMGSALGLLNSDSGYGSDPNANMDAILKGVEGGIGPKYSVY